MWLVCSRLSIRTLPSARVPPLLPLWIPCKDVMWLVRMFMLSQSNDLSFFCYGESFVHSLGYSLCTSFVTTLKLVWLPLPPVQLVEHRVLGRSDCHIWPSFFPENLSVQTMSTPCYTKSDPTSHTRYWHCSMHVTWLLSLSRGYHMICIMSYDLISPDLYYACHMTCIMHIPV